MGTVLDREIAFTVAHFANTYTAAIKKYAGIPYCKAITDYLKLKSKTSVSELSTPEAAELRAHMERIVMALELVSNTFLEARRVPSKTALSEMDLIHYNECMKAAAEREDHFP